MFWKQESTEIDEPIFTLETNEMLLYRMNENNWFVKPISVLPRP
jgi:hypothetical protein